MKIIFVCAGNTCRSPMAEAILKHKLKQTALPKIMVSSAGLMVQEGSKIAQNSQLALKQMGIKATGFKPKPLTLKMANKSSYIITMTESLKMALKGSKIKHYCSAKDFIGEDILDPYGMDLSVYIQTSKQIEKLVDVIIEKLLSDMRKGEL